MKTRRPLALALSLCALAASACGPNISVTRMQAAPSRSADCDLEFVQIDMARVTVDKEWTIVGYVNLSETGVQDPLSGRYRKIVRPEACALGGKAVAIGLSSSNQGAMGAGSGTIYAVLVPYTEPSNETSSF